MPGPYAMENKRTLGQVIRYEDEDGIPKNPWDGALTRAFFIVLSSVVCSLMVGSFWLFLSGVFASAAWLLFVGERYFAHPHSHLSREEKVALENEPLEKIAKDHVREDPMTLSTGSRILPHYIQVNRVVDEECWEADLFEGPTDFTGIKKWILEQFPEDKEAARYALKKAHLENHMLLLRVAFKMVPPREKWERSSQELRMFFKWMSSYKTKHSKYRFEFKERPKKKIESLTSDDILKEEMKLGHEWY